MEQISTTAKPAGTSMEINREEFALSLKTYRLRQGLTQKQLGERMGVSRYTIIRAEKCKNITWESAYRIFAKLSRLLEAER